MASFSADRFAIGVLLVIMFFVVAAFAHSKMGWSSFGPFAGGDSVKFTPAEGKKLSGLRFRNAIFSVRPADEDTATEFDVSQVLNAMAVAWGDSPANLVPSNLKLSAKLNAFSFIKKGFNDNTVKGEDGATETKSRDNTAARWKNATVSLSGEIRGIY